MGKVIQFPKRSFVGRYVYGSTIDRLLTLGDIVESAFDSDAARWVRMVVRVYRDEVLPYPVALALDEIDEAARDELNRRGR